MGRGEERRGEACEERRGERQSRAKQEREGNGGPLDKMISTVDSRVP